MLSSKLFLFSFILAILKRRRQSKCGKEGWLKNQVFCKVACSLLVQYLASFASGCVTVSALTSVATCKMDYFSTVATCLTNCANEPLLRTEPLKLNLYSSLIAHICGSSIYASLLSASAVVAALLMFSEAQMTAKL